jgi:hypothetical protein
VRRSNRGKRLAEFEESVIIGVGLMVQIGGSNLKWFYGPRTGRSRLEKRLSGSIQDPVGGCTGMAATRWVTTASLPGEPIAGYSDASEDLF